MMILFSTEHWLLSQSTFIIRIIRIDWTGIPAAEWTVSGFSLGPGAIGKVVDTPLA